MRCFRLGFYPYVRERIKSLWTFYNGDYDYFQASGVKLGRPVGTIVKSKLDGKEKAIQELLEKHVPVASIAKIFNVARTTLQTT